MVVTFKSKRSLSLIIGSIVVLFFVWFGWNSYVTKANLVQTKVKVSLNDGLLSMVRNTPRVLVNNSYYAPDVTSLHNNTSYVVYTRLLYDLNHDISSPMVKITNVRINSDLQTTITAYADVESEYLPWVTKTIIVSETIPAPHFKSTTGMELVNGKSFLN